MAMENQHFVTGNICNPVGLDWCWRGHRIHRALWHDFCHDLETTGTARKALWKMDEHGPLMDDLPGFTFTENGDFP